MEVGDPKWKARKDSWFLIKWKSQSESLLFESKASIMGSAPVSTSGLGPGVAATTFLQLSTGSTTSIQLILVPNYTIG